MSDPIPAVEAAAEAAGEGILSTLLSLNGDQEKLSDLLKPLRHDPTLMGCLSLGEDGFMRSLRADRDVVDAVALSPRLIKAHLDRIPFDQKTEDLYSRVDGTSVPRAQWFHPDKSLLPPPMSEEQKEKTRKMIEANWEIMSQQMEKVRNGEPGGCGAVVRSNYNLGKKHKDEKKQE